MARGNAKTQFNFSGFFCMQCGNGITLPRKLSGQKSKHHRKKLYCPHCKKELNFIECRNQWEIDEFKENFENGVYIDESESSIEYCNK